MHTNIFNTLTNSLPESYEELLLLFREQYDDIQDWKESVKTVVSYYLDDDTFEYLNNRYDDNEFESTLRFIINLKYESKLEQDLSDIYEADTEQ